MDIDMVLPIAAEQFCLVSYWLPPHFPDFHQTPPTGTFAQWVSFSLAFSSSLLMGLSELPRGHPKTFGHIPAAFLYLPFKQYSN
jgi:hypothetical protein